MEQPTLQVGVTVLQERGRGKGERGKGENTEGEIKKERPGRGQKERGREMNENKMY